MGQKDKQFSPQVKAIHVKEKVDFKNYDDIFTMFLALIQDINLI